MIERMARCACGQVEFRAVGPPIVSAICCCADCQAAGRMIEALGGAAPVLDPLGGTAYLTFRDDRIVWVRGAELLRAVRLSPAAPTTRYVASCCQSAMSLKHRPGWWTSTYAARFGADAPPPQMRNKVASLSPGVVVPHDMPNYPGFPPALFLRLIAARLAMGLRPPREL